MQRYKYEDARRMFLESGLILLENDYKSVDQKMLCEDMDGYRYIRTLRTVIDKRDKTVMNPHIFSSKNPMAWYNIRHYMDVNVGNGTKLASDESDYVNSDSKLLFICGKCGKTYRKRFLDFKHDYNKVCPQCYKSCMADAPHGSRNDGALYEAKASEVGLRILTDDNIRYKDTVEVEDKDGYRGIISVSSFMGRGCSFKRYYVKNPYTIYNMRHFAEINGATCTIKDQPYHGDNAVMTFVCECGNEYKTTPVHFAADKKFQCNECRMKQSNIARHVQDYLDFNSLNYEKEFTFKDCTGNTGRCLPFDFFLPEYNACIEVDGVGHYKAIPWGGISKEDAEKHLDLRKFYDKVKNKYCEDNCISLLRIPFWHIENSEQYKGEIDDFILSIQG